MALMMRHVREFLPKGEALSQEEFEYCPAPHRALHTRRRRGVRRVSSGSHAERNLLHLVADLTPLIVLSFIAVRWHDPTLAKIAASFSLMMSATVLVHVTGGALEAHFSYFVLLPLVALYQDWRPFLVGVVFILVSHLLVGTVLPGVMYNSPMALAHPVPLRADPRWRGAGAGGDQDDQLADRGE